MDGLKCVIVLLGVCVCLTPAGNSAQGRDVPERTAAIPNVSMRLGGLRITSKVIELRCEVRNDSKQDIWLCSGRGLGNGPTRTALFMDTDGETLIVQRRMNAPKHSEVYANAVSMRYDRLPAGQSRAETLLVTLPTNVNDIFFCRGFVKPADGDAMEATRLALEIGCYTTEFLNLPFRRKAGHQARIRFGESGGQVVVTDYYFGWLWRHERAVRMTIEGASIPYGDWLDFVRDDSRIEVPGLSKLEIPFAGKPRKEPEEPEPEPTPLEQLETLFYDFSLGVEDYRYAKRLFGVDEHLFDDTARAIADAYLDLAQGKLNCKDLSARLDKLGTATYRDRVLNELESRAAADQESKN